MIARVPLPSSGGRGHRLGAAPAPGPLGWAWLRAVAVPGLAVAAVLGLLAFAAPATALTQRGHVFGFSFASKGEGAGRLNAPAGVAVDEASGDVYVVDAANNRVERFAADGTFMAAWGWGVSDGKAEYEMCASACKAGIAGEGQAQFDAPSAIAVDDSKSGEDPSRGNVYVLADTASAADVIQKFSPSGQPLGRLALPAGSQALGGVAVDASGTVWVSDLGAFALLSFSDALENLLLTGSIRLEVECEAPGFAVDANADSFYLAHQLKNLEAECPESAPTAKAPALMARLGVGGEVISEALDQEDSSAVAVDLTSSAASPLGEAARGDVYVDNLTSIAVFGADGSLIQRFGTAEQLGQGAGVAIDAATGDVYVADAKGDRVDVFELQASAAPSVDGLSFSDETATSTRLSAKIDPHGADTHYYFQYGTADCRAVADPCTSVPAPPGEDIGQGFGARAVSAVVGGLAPGTTYFYRLIATNEHGQAEGAQIFGTFTTLPSALDVLADNRAWELVSPPEKRGALIYPIAGAGENGAPASGLIEASRDGSAITYAANGQLGQGVSGNRALEATQVISSRTGEGWSTQDIATPHEFAEGLNPGAAQEYRVFSPDLSLSVVQPFGLNGTRMQQPPLVHGAAQEERGLYMRHDVSCESEPSVCYEALVGAEDDTTKAQFGGELEFASATPDLRHVVFSSSVALSISLPSAPGLYEWSAGEPGAEALSLISVLPGNQRAASESQLGDFSPGVSDARNAISTDGTRVFFSALSEERSAQITRLYMRDVNRDQTIVLNAAQGVKELPAGQRAKEEVHFRGASAAGSRAFFTDNFPLTAQSRLPPSEEGPADLYACEIAQGPEGSRCELRDLTVAPNYNTGESADVVGTLPGMSEDGSSVYFVANGVLDEEARSHSAEQGHCARSGQQAVASATCNLYVEHYDEASKEWEAPRFIARLSQQDSPDWGVTGGQSLGELTSRVSTNGRFLAFMSSQPLTGYDNVDQSDAAHGARDEEVYLYDASEGRLVCASCDPSGAPPQGVLDHEPASEGKGLLVDRFGVWQETEAEEKGGQRRVLDHWLAGSIPGWTPVSAFEAFYQSRYLSDEGRLFFNSADALVPHDHNGKEDVYEYEPPGLGTCTSTSGCVSLISSGESVHESAFMDASESGADAFFLTSQPLVSSDHDNAFDLYDARACSQASPCLSGPPSEAQPCEALQTCRPASPAASTFAPASGTATFSGPGNQSQGETAGSRPTSKPKPLIRTQKLHAALRRCRRAYRTNKRKRTACELLARKRYAPKRAVSKARRTRRRSR